MSKLEQISAFILIVEERSFVGAARKLGISTAAISRQIRQLEAALNTELLKRTTRQIELTENGTKYYQQCKTILDDLKNTEMALSEKQTEATGILSVTCSRHFAINCLLPKLPDFLLQNPRLKIKLELAERFPNFAKENIDLLFGVSMEGPLDLIRKRVATTRYVICASPGYLKKYGIPKVPADLKQHLYITHSMRQPEDIITFKNNKKIIVEPILWLNDSRAICECALQGMGIVKLHDYIVADALKNKTLIEVLRDYQEPQQSVFLYYRKSRYLPAKIRYFIDYFSEKI